MFEWRTSASSIASFLNMLLSIFATVPMPFLQHYLHSSFLARLVIEHLPPLTIIIQKLWIQAII